MKLKTGWIPRAEISAKNTRGAAFHGMGAFVGIGQDPEGSRLYGGINLPSTRTAYKKIDPKKLAVELDVDMCAVNSGRFWMMDELEFVGRRHRRLPWCRVALGRRHDRGRDDRPVPERLFARP